MGVGPDVNSIECTDVSGEKFATLIPRLNRAKNEVTIFRISPGGHVNYDLFIPINITLRDPSVRSTPFGALFWAWWGKVREIIETLNDETRAAS